MSYDRTVNVLVDTVDIKPETGTLQIDSPITHGSKGHPRPQDSEENRGSMGQSAGQSSTSVVDQVRSPADDAGVTSSSTICPAPVCRQFWKAGNYNDGLSSKSQSHNGKNYLHVHPMFLHSNATSHKWAFGAVAELLDNAVDEPQFFVGTDKFFILKYLRHLGENILDRELAPLVPNCLPSDSSFVIQNGATFVIVDKTTNPRDGTPALLIQDDGGGMDPHAMRHCMGFGFSDKKSKSAIGRYGNGFKTSTMRLGADVIVFSRHIKNQTWTQSIGLLSYTYLTLAGHDRIVVPILDYEFKASANKFETLQDQEQFRSSLSILLEWSPFSTEAELLQQFDDVGRHGTKVIIYNMWLNNDAKLELDFNSVAEDILIEGNIKKTAFKIVNEHIASRFSYSLRVYLSILYLRIPETFKIVLRGKVVEHHNIADDLKHPQYILYKPQAAGNAEAAVVTTIGFLKEAPKVNLHGFCVYHRNRLIMPFWQVLSCSDGRGRGVVGVLEANFVEPTHNKQEFEKTLLLQKLETRLKDMTLEYWDVHCVLIGYRAARKSRPQISQNVLPNGSRNDNNIPKNSAGVIGRPAISPPPGLQAISAPPGFQAITSPPGFQARSAPPGFQASPRVVAEPVLLEKRKEHPDVAASPGSKRKVGNDVFTIPRRSPAEQFIHGSTNRSKDPSEVAKLMEENKKLRAKCLDHKLRNQTLEIKAFALRTEIGNVNSEYDRLMAEVQALGLVKAEQRIVNT